jgi:hypothetical protein
MKTKLILIAVIALIGISLFSAFKQSESSKRYLTIYIWGESSPRWVQIYDENNQYKEISVKKDDDFRMTMNKMINEYSQKGYKFLSFEVNEESLKKESIYLVFEKE